VTYQVINASLLLPQHRQRAYFVGIRSDLSAECALFRWPRVPVLQRPVQYILQPDAMVKQCYLSAHQWQKILSNPHYQKDPTRRQVRRWAASSLQSQSIAFLGIGFGARAG
jgi:site-specific DNA-cytosine methylase